VLTSTLWIADLPVRSVIRGRFLHFLNPPVFDDEGRAFAGGHLEVPDLRISRIADCQAGGRRVIWTFSGTTSDTRLSGSPTNTGFPDKSGGSGFLQLREFTRRGRTKVVAGVGRILFGGARSLGNGPAFQLMRFGGAVPTIRELEAENRQAKKKGAE